MNLNLNILKNKIVFPKLIKRAKPVTIPNNLKSDSGVPLKSKIEKEEISKTPLHSTIYDTGKIRI